MSRPRACPRFIMVEVFCDPRSVHYVGYSEKAVERKKESGVWRFGQVLRKAPDGHIMVDLDGYEDWVEGKWRADEKAAA
jgi:hypothetical protein